MVSSHDPGAMRVPSRWLDARYRHRSEPAPENEAPARAAEVLSVDLGDAHATDASLCGVKAARLAEAGLAGLPIARGEVITTTATTTWGAPSRESNRSEPLSDVAGRVWASVSQSGSVAVVVRSSSPNEDGAHRSMAGQFASVTDVRDHREFIVAVDEVIESSHVDGLHGPMAVLVQEQVEPRASGVLFTVDPMNPTQKGYSVAYVEGSPAGLVGGVRNGHSTVISRRGRRIDGSEYDGVLTRDRSRRLAALASQTEELFGSPQDIEWAFDANDQLRLLQSRPITTLPPQAAASGPVFGAGPVAETFPERLSPLEVDMWVGPMADGLRATMSMLCVAPQAQLDASPIVTDHDGWVVCDLDLLEPRPPGFARRLFDPRPTVRRLRGAWRMGRLRAALPLLSRRSVSRADSSLAAVDHPTALTDAQLAAVVANGRRSLVALHAQEAAAGVFIETDGGATTAQSAALRVLVDCREGGLTDRQILETEPAVLSLFAPAVFPAERHLPDIPPEFAVPTAGSVDELAILREALKLRIRWTQELMAVCIRTLAGRLAGADRLADPRLVLNLTLDQLVVAALTHHVPIEPDIDAGVDSAGPPARFRYTRGGEVVALHSATDEGAIGVSAGRVSGLTWNLDDGAPPPDRILVTAHMDPKLAHHLPTARGLIAESGNSLSHLAILARELSVPAVAQVGGARNRFPTGSSVAIDGWDGSIDNAVGSLP